MTGRPRIGLNALFLDPGVSGGSETYVRGLVPAMTRAFPEAELEIATTRRGAAALAREPWAGSVRILRLRCDDDEPLRRTLVEQLALPRLARSRGWDVLHSLSNRGPRRPGVPAVVTIHDVIFFEHRTMGLVSTYGMRWAVRAAVAGARELIAVSEAAADEIAATPGVDRDRITAIPHGAGRPAVQAAPLEEVRRRYGLGEDACYVLCVAAKRPHKNQALLVRAMPELAGDVELLLVGHDEGYGSELEAVARAARVEGRVRLLEHVPDRDLEAIWALAGCAAFPTRAEGFGLPVIEAMQRGVPVACSDIPVLREVGGSVPHYFDPDDAGSAARAIAAALAASGAGEAGRERAALFSWERAARATFAVYERALAR